MRRNRGDRLWGLELECETNRRFPSYLSPLFQSESWCEAVHMEISFIHMQIWVHFHVNKTNFHMKGFALGLALVQRRNGTRKSPILLTLHIISCQIVRIKIIFHSETVASFVRSLTVPATCHSRVPDALWAPIEGCIHDRTSRRDVGVSKLVTRFATPCDVHVSQNVTGETRGRIQKQSCQIHHFLMHQRFSNFVYNINKIDGMPSSTHDYRG